MQLICKPWCAIKWVTLLDDYQTLASNPWKGYPFAALF